MNNFLEVLSGGNPTLIVVVISLLLLTNHKRVLEFFDDIRYRKVKQIQILLKDDLLDKTTKEHLINIFNDEAFKLTTGIQGNKFFRLELFEQAKGKFSLNQVRRADRYIYFEKGNIVIKFFWFEKVFAWISGIFGALLIIMALNSLVSVLNNENILQLWTQIIIYIIGLGMGFMSVLHLVYLIVAQKLSPIFQSLQKDEV